MFRKMRRFKQELTKDESKNILKKQQRGFLSVHGDDNYPYTIPMNYLYQDGKIFLHSAKEGHFKDSIKANDKVCFCVLNDGKKVDNKWYYTFKSVIIFGRIKIITDYNEKHDILTKLGNKYFPTEEETNNVVHKLFKQTEVLKIEIEHITGKKVTEK